MTRHTRVLIPLTAIACSAAADIIPISQTSTLEVFTIVGSSPGPYSQTLDDMAEQTDLLRDVLISLDVTNDFAGTFRDRPFRGIATASSRQEIGFTTDGSRGLRIVGEGSTHAEEVLSMATVELATNDNDFFFEFEVDAETAWSLSLTRTADPDERDILFGNIDLVRDGLFLVSNGIPQGDVTSYFDSGVLEPGRYTLRARFGAEAANNSFASQDYTFDFRLGTLAAEPGCDADIDGNGRLDVFDIFGFFDLFNAGDPRAELTGDGTFDLFDLLAYFERFSAGC